MEIPITNGNGNSRWRISKDIPLSLVGALGLQTIFFAVWLAGMASTLKSLVEQFGESKTTAYSKDEARHEREFMDQKFMNLANKDDETTRRIALLEAQLNELKNRVNRP